MKMTEKLLKNIIKESIKKILLNEISIKDKYQKEQSKLNMPFGTFEQLCNLDPTTKPNKVGGYTNWIIAKYNPNADLRKLQRCLEWYSDGAKRGILTRYNIPLDINQYKSYDEFISTMDSLSDDNDTSMSQSEYNNRQKLEGQFEVLGSTSFYDIVAPKTYAAERYFGSNTSWCTVANEEFFNSYSKKGQLYIIYPKNGDDEYKMQFHFEDKQFADKYDEVYENPMECIEQVVNDEGVKRDLIELCRKLFSKYKILFTSFNERLDDAKQRLLNGESPEVVFDYYDEFAFDEEFAEVKLNGKLNFIKTNGEFLSDTWFDWWDTWHNGFTVVCLNDKYNFLGRNGEFLSDTWFDKCGNFYNGIANVTLNGKCNYIKTNGEFLSDTWFDWWGVWINGFTVVCLNGKYNFIKRNGKLVSGTWFDEHGSYYSGFINVTLNGKEYILDITGKLYDTKGNLIQTDIRNGININENKKNDIMKITEKQLRKIIRESLQEILSESRFSDNEERSDMNNLAKSIVADLKALNFEERGHEIHVDTQDEYEPYVAVYYMNVPSNADCREIAKKHNCYFYVDNSWDIGVFDLTQEYVH